MKKILKDIFIHNKGSFVIRRMPQKNITDLINKLHPKRTNRHLIRLGPSQDGGYLIPDDLEGIEACFSPGVDKISEFELSCYQRGMKIFFADKTVDQPNISLPKEQYDFLKKHIGCTDNDDYITIDKWVNERVPGKADLLFQIDIEGDEFPVLLNMSPDLLNRIRILVIEFHAIHELWNPHYFWYASLAFNKILTNHTCVHIHPNNCCGVSNKFNIPLPSVLEFTFLRNDRFLEQGYASTFPHPLDMPNTEKTDLSLPENWYRKSY